MPWCKTWRPEIVDVDQMPLWNESTSILPNVHHVLSQSTHQLGWRNILAYISKNDS